MSYYADILREAEEAHIENFVNTWINEKSADEIFLKWAAFEEGIDWEVAKLRFPKKPIRKKQVGKHLIGTWQVSGKSMIRCGESRIWANSLTPAIVKDKVFEFACKKDDYRNFVLACKELRPDIMKSFAYDAFVFRWGQSFNGEVFWVKVPEDGMLHLASPFHQYAFCDPELYCGRFEKADNELIKTYSRQRLITGYKHCAVCEEALRWRRKDCLPVVQKEGKMHLMFLQTYYASNNRCVCGLELDRVFKSDVFNENQCEQCFSYVLMLELGS